MEPKVINEDYVRRLTAGDREVEAHFVWHFGTVMRIKLRSKLHSHQMIDDIRQETFLRVFKTLRNGHGLDNPERLGPFVYSVCNNVMLEFLRDNSRHPPISDDAPDRPDEHADPSRGVAESELHLIVQRVLNELPPKDCQILRLVFFEDEDKDHICKKMDVSPEYCRVLIHRAKARFRALLEKERKHLPKN